jgi:hypothetical protein
MNDNYLWDRTGEPDAEVQQLEDLLGSLRYQPRPLAIPPTMNVRRKRAFIPLAIAAAIALLMIAQVSGCVLQIPIGDLFCKPNARLTQQHPRPPLLGPTIS